MKRLLIAIGVLVFIVLGAWVGVKIHLSRPVPSTGEAPKGYASSKEIMAAIALGELKLINMNPPLPEGVAEFKDLEYGRVGERKLLLDLFTPTNLAKAVPAILFIHGGAWKGGKRQDYRVYTTHFAKLGYVTATISYRLLPEAAFPAAVEDAKCAVRWLRDNAAQYKVDPERIAVLGGSAGGHLALMVGYTAGNKELEGQGGHPNVDSRVAAVIDFYGPSDLTTPFALASKLVYDFLGGKTYEQARDRYQQASPLHHLTASAPPTLIFHGTIDDIVPIDQSDSLAAKLKQLGVPYEYERLEGWPHTMDAGQPVNNYCKARIAAFLSRHLPL